MHDEFYDYRPRRCSNLALSRLAISPSSCGVASKEAVVYD